MMCLSDICEVMLVSLEDCCIMGRSPNPPGAAVAVSVTVVDTPEPGVTKVVLEATIHET